ncbi:DNA-directed RNA polymerase subunit L [Candidatus Woesearchaeota archaeon]|nr:DNA-directed RNA polymerase subunit L [Candidatus Woesearchaeota archaeon]
MEIKIIEEKKNRIALELKGLGHGFCNALVKELYNDKDTKSAGYHIDHPLIGVPKLIVESKGDARKTIMSAIKRLQKVNDSFKKEIIKSIKGI